MTNDEEWCRQNPGRAAALIAQKDLGWSQCSQACARLQGEARNYQRALGEEYAKREALEVALAEERQANDDLRDVLDNVKAERSALEFERDHLVIAVEQEGLQIGSHGSGLGITEASLARLKTQWQIAILMEYHQYCKAAQAEWREPMSAHEWASEVLERSRQAGETADE